MADPEPSDPPSEIDRTRSGVVNVLIGVAAGIAASGWLLRDHDITVAPPGGTRQAHQVAMAVLVGLVAIGYATLRVGSGRPGSGKSRVRTAIVGGLTVPLGLAHGWFVDPALPAIAPFWVAALGLGALAFPRQAGPIGEDERAR